MTVEAFAGAGGTDTVKLGRLSFRDLRRTIGVGIVKKVVEVFLVSYKRETYLKKEV
jgi:hypothetical protein